MSVQSDPTRGVRSRPILIPVLCLALICAVLGASTGWSQESAASGEEVATLETSDLRSRVTASYSVVVLSRGLLLEPLDGGVEMLTIEIVDDSVAIDGEAVDEAELRAQVGDENAELVLELAAMDRAERRLLFEGGGREIAIEASADQETSVEAIEEESGDEENRRYRDSQVSVGNSLTVEENEVANEALVFGGPLFVYGKVAGDAVAVGGSVTVSGEVTGDVAAVGGNLTLEAGAEVLGDVVSVGGEVDIDDEAKVRGQIIEVPFGPNLKFGAWPAAIFGGRHAWRGSDDLVDLSPWGMASNVMWEGFKLLVLGLFACFVMLVAREPLERVKNRAASEPWKSGLVGLLVQILFAPLLVLVTLILVISIIGIPLVLLVPFFVLALLLVAFLGYAGVALGIGQFLQKRFGWNISNPYFVLLLGVLTIQILSIVGDLLDFGWGPLWFFAVMFGVLGALVKYVAWTVGLGAAFLTRFGTAEGWGGSQQAIQPQAPMAQQPPEPYQPAASPPPQIIDPPPISPQAEPPAEGDEAGPRSKPPGSGIET